MPTTHLVQNGFPVRRPTPAPTSPETGGELASRGGWLLLVWMFVVGFSQIVQFRYFGRVYLTDGLMLATVAMALVSHRRIPMPPRLGVVVLLCGLWLGSQVVTDLVRHTPSADIARGWGKIGFTLVGLLAIASVSRDSIAPSMALLCGLMASKIVMAFAMPDETVRIESWKWGYGLPVTFFVIAGISLIPRRSVLVWAGLAAPFLLSAVSLYHNFKSLFGITFLVGVLNVISHIYRAWRLRPVTLLAAGVIVAAAYFAATAAYSTLALDGTLGGIAQDSMRRREASSLGFLLSGRSESLISTRAIAESPILGHGSWARDPEYVTRYIEILRARGVRQDTAALVRWGTIPTHSHLLGAWVEAGLLGALFWAYCLALTVRAAAQVTLSGMKGSVVVGFLMILLSWDILFSPYGAERRFYDAAYLVIAVIMLQRLRTRADV